MHQSSDAFLQLLADLGAEIGEDLSPDPSGVLTLVLDDESFSLESPEGSSFVYLQAAIRRLGPNRAADLEAAMRLNLFGHPLSNAWLALDPEGDALRLCCAISLDGLDTARLTAFLEAFATAIGALRHSDALPASGTLDTEIAQHFVRI
ncbi:type III secretion system chaperone [Prosthecodimorpha staleyi]|uniref:Type III secretion system chaperone n=1 Tax=Prosthecodimorpha staleyi TaxID=2840188 RepID=A0A947D3U4_9HYPH|nr:type III secretion system chaperone [Prosthecodimorpha staleyi]MBT9290281.1 type III secretion system chaperone [Prosthecodimorpha staleyi]